jgi:hypothetical protein
MSGSNTGPGRANIQGFGQLNEFDTRGVRSTEKNRDLETNSGRPAPLRLIQVLPFLKTFDSHSAGP